MDGRREEDAAAEVEEDVDEVGGGLELAARARTPERAAAITAMPGCLRRASQQGAAADDGGRRRGVPTTPPAALAVLVVRRGSAGAKAAARMLTCCLLTCGRWPRRLRGPNPNRSAPVAVRVEGAAQLSQLLNSARLWRRCVALPAPVERSTGKGRGRDMKRFRRTAFGDVAGTGK